MFRYAAIGLLLSTASASAWDTVVAGPDVFGDTKVSSRVGGQLSDLVVHCTAYGELKIAFISRKKEFEDVTPVAGYLYIAVPPAPAIQFDATLQAWNDNYSGVVAAEDRSRILKAIGQIRDANGQIQVGSDVLGKRWTENLSSSGSTDAMNKVISGCRLKLD
ncbi:MAG: hypothetical protein KF874_07100 [Rhizobiaceae bacterium]|nr:hypothetical protein [Rhizobiaceae bacterium]